MTWRDEWDDGVERMYEDPGDKESLNQGSSGGLRNLNRFWQMGDLTLVPGRLLL